MTTNPLQSRSSIEWLDMRQMLLDYEIRSSIWASWVGIAALQNLAARYFARKVNRKMRRWMRSREWAAERKAHIAHGSAMEVRP